MTHFKTRKIPYYLSLFLLMSGASVILGFLSFSGMFLFLPGVAPALAALILAVIYEGEIYWQNIKGSLKKLTKSEYVERALGKECLLDALVEKPDANGPQFFKDYEALREQLDQLQFDAQGKAIHLDKAGKELKKQIAKELSDMEKWFSRQLFAKNKTEVAPATPAVKSNKFKHYQEALQNWFNANNQTDWQKKAAKQKKQFTAVKAFSTLAAIFMAVSTSYLLLECSASFPLLAALSFSNLALLISPLAIIAGVAYGFLTYNALTDMIANETLQATFRRIKEGWKKGFNARNAITTAATILLAALAILLTVCTAGTWWTVVKKTKGLFSWMGRMPSFIMGIINPIITGLASIIFNVENICETLDLIDESKPTGWWSKLKKFSREFWAALTKNENSGQKWNPFRLLIKLTLTPLRILFFIGHLLSIALTADQVPFWSATVSAIMAFLSECFEDMHYFFGHNHDTDEEKTARRRASLNARLARSGGHNHGHDLPSMVLKLLFLPIFFLAAVWDFAFSRRNEPEKRLSFMAALKKQLGIKDAQSATLMSDATQPSATWKHVRADFVLERHKEKHLRNISVKKTVAKEREQSISKIQDEIRNNADSENMDELSNILTTEPKAQYDQHRLFARKGTHTKSYAFMEALPNRLGLRKA